MASVELERRKCAHCGSFLRYDAVNQMLKCDSCGREYIISPYTTLADLKKGEKQSSCPNCGAALKFNPSKQLAECAFCGATYNVITRQGNGETKFSKSNLIIPFSVDDRTAKRRFISWLDLQKTPYDIYDDLKVTCFKGVYVPAYLFDCRIDIDYQYSAGYDHREPYTEYIEERDSRTGRTYSRPVTRYQTVTDYQYVSDSTYSSFAAYGIASKFLNNFSCTGIDFITPIESNISGKGNQFDSRYLSGFSTLPFDMTKDAVYESRVKGKVKKHVEGVVNSNLQGDRQKGTQWLSSTTYDTKTLYVPYYMLKYSYHDKDCVAFLSGSNDYNFGSFPKRSGIRQIVFMIIAVLLSFFSMIYVDTSILCLIFGLVSFVGTIVMAGTYIGLKIKHINKKEERKENVLANVDRIFVNSEDDISAFRLTKKDALKVQGSGGLSRWADIVLIVLMIIAAAGMFIGMALFEPTYETYNSGGSSYSQTNRSSFTTTQSNNKSSQTYVYTGGAENPNDDTQDGNADNYGYDDNSNNDYYENEDNNSYHDDDYIEEKNEETTEEPTTQERLLTKRDILGTYTRDDYGGYFTRGLKFEIKENEIHIYDPQGRWPEAHLSYSISDVESNTLLITPETYYYDKDNPSIGDQFTIRFCVNYAYPQTSKKEPSLIVDDYYSDIFDYYDEFTKD